MKKGWKGKKKRGRSGKRGLSRKKKVECKRGWSTKGVEW